MSDKVGVLYLGKLMEAADTDSVYSKPKHPYTHALMARAAAAIHSASKPMA